MNRQVKEIIAALLSICMVISGINYIPSTAKAADTLTNVANNRGNYTFMTSNANTPKEGFLYVGNGFTAINCCNENLGNGNNLLGKTATTEEAAVYVDLGKDYDISNAKIYQGSTNANFYDSYCRNYSIYYSTEQVTAANVGNVIWNLAGTCINGSIYNGAKIKNAENVSASGDEIIFGTVYTARSIKIVFDKESCMGTGTNGGNTGITGTVSLLSIRVYGTAHVEETTTPEETTTGKLEETTSESGEQDNTLYASYNDDLALKSSHSAVKGYASSNLRNGSKVPVSVNNLTNGNTTGTNYIIANTTGGDTNPWFAVDLGSVQDINKVTIIPGADAVTYPNAYPINYKIQVASETMDISSAAGIETLAWVTVATVTDGELAAKSVTFPRKNARYVRILVDTYADYCSLYELSIYQTDDRYLLGQEPKTMKVLFVGNSMTYYNTLCKGVESFANAQGKNIQCEASTAGGQNLIYHSNWTDGTVAKIKTGNYDVVILQDIVGSFDGDKLMKGATDLVKMIKEANSDTKVLFYMPWPVQGSLTGEASLLPYFTYNYIKTARALGASLAPAGEAYYELYNKYTNVDWYVADEKHPHAIGTFVSNCSVYYALFPEAERVVIDDENQAEVNAIINAHREYSNDDAKQYDAKLLDDISKYAYERTKAVQVAVEDVSGKTKYTSVAGEYNEVDTVVEVSAFSKVNGNVAVGCSTYASSEISTNHAAGKATDGITNGDSRWESNHGSDDEWIYVDLGSVKHIDKVGFIWEGAYAKKYQIQVADKLSSPMTEDDWKTVETITASSAKTVQIDLESGTTGRYVRMKGVTRGTTYGYSFFEMGVWEEYKVSVDDKINYVEPESTYKLGDAKYGYYSDGKMYPAGYEFTVNKDVSFTAVKELNVSVTEGAGIKMTTPSGLRFRAMITSDNMKAVEEQGLLMNPDEAVIKAGMLITTNDLYGGNDSELSLTSTYNKFNIVNSGWFGSVGTYCGAVVNIGGENYTRSFIARAYVTVTYVDGTSVTIYSGMTGARSIKEVAEMVKNTEEEYNSLKTEQRQLIDIFAAARES